MDKPVFMMLVGVPGAGKSTYAKSLSQLHSWNIVASDEIRKELTAKEGTWTNEQVWDTAHNRVENSLLSGQGVILDATSINRKKRLSLLNRLKKIDCDMQCTVVATPYEQCLINNVSRDTPVPEEVIKRMILGFNVPLNTEGFSHIYVHYPLGHPHYSIPNFLELYDDYNQENVHHELTLSQHCFRAAEIAAELVHMGDRFKNRTRILELIDAAVLHDCGKPLTQSHINSKGELTEEAHYYNHHNAGAYLSLFYAVEQDHNLRIAQIIEFHMRPYLEWKDSKRCLKNDMQLLGVEMYEDIVILHAADKMAH